MENSGYISDEIPNEKSLSNGHSKGKTSVEVEEDDPWKVTSVKQDFTPWSQLNTKEKWKRVLGYMIKVVLVLGFLYLFICSLDFLSSAFRLLGGETAGRVFKQNDIMSNPVAGLMMGVLVTVLVQSSSTSTSIIVSMVGADLLDIKTAIPIVMGANIGTSVTNTIVAIGQINDKGEFRRAFAGATVHDMFNWLTVIILLPIEVATDYLYHLSDKVVGTLPLETNEDGDQEILKVITEPFTKKIVQVNKKAITNIAKDVDVKYEYDRTVLKICCDKPTRDKCCKTSYGKLDDFKYVTYSDAHKRDFCTATGSEALASCGPIGQSPTVTENACMDLPWKMSTMEDSEDWVKSVDCSKLTSHVPTACCESAVSDFILNTTATRSWDEGCQRIAACNSSIIASDFSQACLASVKDVKTRETFDCFKWTTTVINSTCQDECSFLFRDLHPDMSDEAIGAILLVLSLLVLCICLVAIVKLLHSVLQGPIATIIKKFVNADFPGPFGYFTGYIAILIGAGLTFVVQSSSIFTSTLTPLVGIGVIELDRMYPLTLGSNIGTTTTAILSALASDSAHLRDTLQVAFCHLFFNISGILIFYPLPFMRVPIPMAKYLGNRTANYRWYAIVYIILMFFAFPAIIFGLSVPGWYVLLAVAGPFALLAIVVIIIKVIQNKKPGILPKWLRDWKFLPAPLRSLKPYDNIMKKIFFCARFQMDEEGQQEQPDSNGDAHSDLKHNGENGVNGLNGVNKTPYQNGHQNLSNTKL